MVISISSGARSENTEASKATFSPRALVSAGQKWVTRLNSDEFFAKAKLKHEVTCLTCHETNPAEGVKGN